jgi:hypothetical protein
MADINAVRKSPLALLKQIMTKLDRLSLMNYNSEYARRREGDKYDIQNVLSSDG